MLWNHSAAPTSISPSAPCGAIAGPSRNLLPYKPIERTQPTIFPFQGLAEPTNYRPRKFRAVGRFGHRRNFRSKTTTIPGTTIPVVMYYPSPESTAPE